MHLHVSVLGQAIIRLEKYVTQIYITIIQPIRKGALPQTYIGVVKENCPQKMYKYLMLIIELLVVDDGLRC
jgi:hypothetical protein